MAGVRLIDISRRYAGRNAAAVESVYCEIEDGEFFILLGPSGCGKSTLLKLVAGLEDPDEGQIWLGDELVNHRPPGARNIAMVFQNYALYPHMTVGENIRFPLRMRKKPRPEQAQRVMEAAKMIELENELDRWVGELSGGQRQRVALGRAIVRDPSVMLMDEPLSNLDALLRHQTREELMRLHQRVSVTMIYVTHDQVEALTMGDRIGVMNEGRLVQVATPTEIYDHPADTFVAGFIGSPPMNLLPGKIAARGGRLVFTGRGLDIEVPQAHIDVVRRHQDNDVILGFRPEAVSVKNVDTSTTGWSVELLEHLGYESVATIRNGDSLIRCRFNNDHCALDVGPADLRIDLRKLYFFDGKSGAGLYHG